MKPTRKILSIIFLSIYFILAVGCGKTNQAETSMGRYIEQNMDVEALTGYTSFALQQSDGSLELIDVGEENIHRYVQQKDSSFKLDDSDWIKRYNQKAKERGYFNITAMTVDSKGQIYMACTAMKEEATEGNDEPGEMATYILKITEDDIIETELIDDGMFPIAPDQIIILENGNCIAAQNYIGIKEFDLKTGKIVKTYSEDKAVNSLMLKDNKLYVANSENQSIDIYSLATGQVEEEIKCDKVDTNTRIFQGEKGIYLVSGQGIWHQAENEEIWEQVMEGEGVTLGLPSYVITSAFYQEGQFIVCLQNTQLETAVKAYTYSDTTPSKPEIELTAYMLEDNLVFREALITYELAHPEVRIHVRQGVSDEGGITKADAIKALNTELLAGEGPDLLLLDGLDVATYKDKGVLLNLDEVEGTDQLLPQISKAVKEDDGIYSVPLRFGVPCFIGDSEVLKEINQIDELMTYQKNHMDTPLMYDLETESLYNHMAKLDSKQWLTSEGELSTQKLGDFLEGIKNLKSFYNISGSDMSQEGGMLDELLVRGWIKAYLNNKVKVHLWDIDQLGDILYVGGISDAIEGISFKVVEQEGKACFEPIDVVGINKNSKQVEEVQDVLSFMLSEESQLRNTEGIGAQEGLPVQQSAFQKCLQKAADNDYGISMIEKDGEFIAVNGNSESMLPTFEKIVEQIEIPITRQSVLEEMVLEEATPYWKGEKSLGDVLQTLEPKIALYTEG